MSERSAVHAIVLVAAVILMFVLLAMGALIRDAVVQPPLMVEPMPLSYQCSLQMNCLECHPMHGKVY